MDFTKKDPEVEQLLSNFTITNEDLRKNKYQYSQEELERNTMGLRFFTILCNQKVNAQFIAKYILNDDYYEDLTPDKMNDIIDKLSARQNGQEGSPTRPI